MKTNFRKIKKNSEEIIEKNQSKELTPEEFEEYVIKSGARGSFMIYRSKNKDEEMGIDEL
jgi:hypothetical protein